MRAQVRMLSRMHVGARVHSRVVDVALFLPGVEVVAKSRAERVQCGAVNGGKVRGMAKECQAQEVRELLRPE